MKRVIIDLMETQKDVEDFNRVSEQITNSPRYRVLTKKNLKEKVE